MERNLKASYGGFLPLELNPGIEWFDQYKQNCRSFNSVKAGLDCLIRKMGIRELSVPYYYCPSTTQAIRNAGVHVHFYHINNQFMPEPSVWEDGRPILLVNYFGILEKQIDKQIQSHKDNIIILDNAHAFFAQPHFAGNLYTLYSAKKFFGVPDGAYLVGKNVKPHEEKPEYAADYLHYSAVTFEQGTNVAYREKKAVDNMLSSHYAGMSILAHGLLQNVDYQRVRNRRTENFYWLWQYLQKVNELEFWETTPAYIFPLLCKNGRQVKKKLIEKSVFVPTLWSGENLLNHGNEFEIHMSCDAVFLPIDQRYSKEDMQYLVRLIKELVGEDT